MKRDKRSDSQTEEPTRSLAVLRATLEASTDAVLATGDDGRLLVYNERYLRMLGVTRETVDGTDHRGLLAALAGRVFDDPERYCARVEEIYAESPPETYDLLELADGRVVERFTRIQPGVGRVWTFRDVTDRVQAERARERLVAELEREHARLVGETHALETINRMSKAIAAELNLDRLVQMLTDEATRLTGARFGSFFYNVLDDEGGSYMLYTVSGVPREAFDGFPMPRNTAIFAPTFRGEGIVRIDDVTKDPRYGKNPPYHGMPEGHLPVRSYLAVPVVSRSGEVVGGLFFGHPEPGVFGEGAERVIAGIAAQAAIAVDNARLFDALEREKNAADTARERAEGANRAKDEFLAMVSHELRTPLNSMLGWIRLLRSGGLDEAAAARGLAAIERNTVTQAQLIDDLLDVSRVISGKLSLTVERVDLESVVRAAIESVGLAAEAKSIRIQTVFDASTFVVSGDRTRLQQVVGNLLSNAMKFTPKGGNVRVALERVDSSAEIVVSDDGQGISAEFLPHVFERFMQADSGLTRAHGGLGLGLSIVRHIVELHGGSVRAESQGEGRGATFVVRLPLAAVRSEPARAPAASEGAPAGAPFTGDAELAGVRVLVVDDDADAREMLAIVLSQCAAEVRTASSAAEAFEVLGGPGAWLPDVLVSDIGMHEEDGYTFIRRVRRLPAERGGAIPAVALTAYAKFDDRMKALSAGFQTHVAKPVEPSELVLVVRNLLDRDGRA